MKQGSKDPKVFVIKVPEKLGYQLYALLLLVGMFLIATRVMAVTPNPGHPWTDLGNGFWQASNSQTALRTFTFPDADAKVLTDAQDVQVSEGGTGWSALQSNTVLLGNGTGNVATTSAGTNGFTLALSNGVPTWIATTTLANITGTLGLTQGGAGAALTASNGGVVYSGASALAVLAGTATAGQILRSGASAAPSWSTATYPATAGTANNVLTSDGTNWVSTAQDTSPTVVTWPVDGMNTGALTANAVASLTTRNVGLFRVASSIVVNQLSFNVGAVTTAGTMKVCVYNAAGTTKYIDVTSATVVAGNNSVTVAGVTLPPGNYYVALGCATTCNDTVNSFTTTSLALVNGVVPAGKKIYEGTVTSASGVCDTTLATITGSNSKDPVVRLDN